MLPWLPSSVPEVLVAENGGLGAVTPRTSTRPASLAYSVTGCVSVAPAHTGPKSIAVPGETPSVPFNASPLIATAMFVPPA